MNRDRVTLINWQLGELRNKQNRLVTEMLDRQKQLEDVNLTITVMQKELKALIRKR